MPSRGCRAQKRSTASFSFFKEDPSSILVSCLYCTPSAGKSHQTVYLLELPEETNTYLGAFYLSSDMSQVYKQNDGRPQRTPTRTRSPERS